MNTTSNDSLMHSFKMSLARPFAPLAQTLHKLFENRKRGYFIKALLLLCFLFLLEQTLPFMSTPVVVVFWLILTTLSAITFIYAVTVRKTEHQLAKYQLDGQLARFNNGRAFIIFIGFVLSGVFSMGLLLSLPKWETTQWAFVIVSIAVYFGFALAFQNKAKTEYKPAFQQKAIIQWSSCCSLVVLCVAVYATEATTSLSASDNVLDAIYELSTPFLASPSAIMHVLGDFSIVSDIGLLYGIPQATSGALGEPSYLIVIAISLVIYASIMLSFINLLGCCYLSSYEIRRAFSPLPTEWNTSQKPALKCGLIVAALVTVLLLAGIILVYDHHLEAVKQTGQQTKIEAFTYAQLDIMAYAIDKKNLGEQAAERIADETTETSTSFINGFLSHNN